MQKVFTTTTLVAVNGVIKPTFNISDKPYRYTSGELKYFHELAGKKVKITIEVLSNKEG